MEPRSFLQHLNPENFEKLALETFERQYKNVPIYRSYVELLGTPRPQTLQDIPFLPISFFKTHRVLPEGLTEQKTFLSSGTTLQQRSQHIVHDLAWYKSSLMLGFEREFGPADQFVFIALLPSYLENGDSSLIYMVDQLIAASQNELSGYYLSELQEVQEVYNAARQQGKRAFIFGVAYALLDLAELGLNLSEALILETGGMKGRRKELSKIELHEALKVGFHVPKIYSEYGMTELLSQAYFNPETAIFKTQAWCKVLIRDAYDPFTYVPDGQKGGINFIDLANQWSCSFIQTDDLGRIQNDGFTVEGRLEATDIRGCNLLID
jgi:phenylacetate-coenzyme A ligase PaaK-like adenylate-forming protein